MKAIVYDKLSTPEHLVMRDLANPVCLANEVLLKIEAVSINAADYRSMQLGIIPRRKIFGADVAGRVESCGESARRFKSGDCVCGDLSGCGFGGFAEFVAAPDRLLASIPPGVSFQEAAALPIAAVTALQALRDHGHAQSGQRVLVYGAGGGVGHFAVQLARYFGTDVTAICSTKNKDRAGSLGAQHVIDYQKTDIFRSGRQFDLVLGINGNRSLLSYTRLLAPHGIFVFVGGSYPQIIQGLLFSGLLSIGNKKFKFLAARPNPEDLAFIIRLVEQGKIKPVIDRCYPLQATAEAVKSVSQGHTWGKVVINVSQS